MADPAVPTDGSDRIVHLLSTARRNALRRLPRAAAIGALALVLGCDGGDTDRVVGEASRGLDPSALVAAIGARRARDDAVAADAGRGTPPTWPADLDFHPDSPAESIELLAVLEDEDGGVWSFDRRLDRVAVSAVAARTASSGDDFAFRDAVRLGGTLARATVTDDGEGRSVGAGRDGPGAGTAVRRDALERVTLGLATAAPRTLSVRDATLSLAPATADGGATEVSSDAATCALDYVLEEEGGLVLRFRQARCPSGAVLGSLALSSSPTLAVDGTLVAGGESREIVSGRAWVRRAWGVPPDPGGAVVFDRLLLALDGVGLVEAERSKRRSGRGPRTTSGRVRADGTDASGATDRRLPPEPFDEFVWRDADGRDGPAEAVGSWTVTVPEAGIDVVLVPLVETAIPDGPFGGARLRAVRADGSHVGVGFVEIVPVDGTDDRAGDRTVGGGA